MFTAKKLFCISWLCTILILGGCASAGTSHWTKEGAGKAELVATSNDCANMASDLSGYKDQQTDFSACMHSKGWTLQ